MGLTTRARLDWGSSGRLCRARANRSEIRANDGPHARYWGCSDAKPIQPETLMCLWAARLSAPLVGHGQPFTRTTAKTPREGGSEPVAFDGGDRRSELIRVFEHSAGE